MAYCSVQAVANLLGFEKFDNTTKPTDTVVLQFIDNAYNKMKFYFTKFGITVKETDYANILSFINALGAAYLVLYTYSNTTTENKTADGFKEWFEKELIDFCFAIKVKLNQPDFNFGDSDG